MSGTTVMVSGMVAGTPGQAGASWSVLQWVLGLRQLGHRAVLVEEIPQRAVAPAGVPLGRSCNARYFLEITARLGITDDACLMVSETGETLGMSPEAVFRAAGESECLLNTSGTLKDPKILERIPVRAYLDVDPGFTQLWDLQGHDLGIDRHNRLLTVGMSVGRPECAIPTHQRSWIRTLPPVVLEHWPAVDAAPARGISTVVNWRGYGSVEHEGVFYGQKVHSFRDLFPLPGLTGAEFELACAIDPAETGDLEQLRRHGWSLVDPGTVAGTAGAYRDFIGRSRAEINVAKDGYVKSGSGWFSDRSACYLASGRPVIAQDTALPAGVPTGDGFLTFDTLETAAERIGEVVGEYARHSRAARAFAEEHLDSRRVIGGVLDEVLR